MSIEELLDPDTSAVEWDELADAIRATLALNTGNNRKLYGNDFEAGMAKALWIVRQTIADKLGTDM